MFLSSDLVTKITWYSVQLAHAMAAVTTTLLDCFSAASHRYAKDAFSLLFGALGLYMGVDVGPWGLSGSAQEALWTSCPRQGLFLFYSFKRNSLLKSKHFMHSG